MRDDRGVTKVAKGRLRALLPQHAGVIGAPFVRDNTDLPSFE